MSATQALPAPTRTRIADRVANLEWRGLLLPWLVSRAIAGAAMVLGASETLSKVTFGALTSWDGTWYLGIAEHGYGAPPVSGQQTHWPFFPLLPGMTRALIEIGIPAKAALVVISNLAFLVALAGVRAIARRHGGESVATYSVWLVALFPLGVIFSMGYPSSIFLAASTWAFVFVEDRRDGAAALCGLIATAVRPNGGLVVVALIVGLVLADRAPHRAALVAGPSVAFVTVWCLLLWRWTDNAFVFWTTKNAWDEVTIFEFLGGPKNGEIPHMIVGGIGIAALLAWGRRLPLSWLVFAGLYLIPSLMLGVVGLGRYVNECFPVVIAASGAAVKWPVWIRLPILAASALAMALFAVMVSRYKYLP